MGAEMRFEDIVRYAIEQEQAAASMYESAAKRTEHRSAALLLEEMAAMERGHETRLKVLLATGMASFPQPGEIRDLHVADYQVAEPLRDDSPLDAVHVFAIKAEQKASELYTRLASVVAEGSTRELLETLAAEEQRHKRDLEEQYERWYMKEN
jgi:rubrerythrin